MGLLRPAVPLVNTIILSVKNDYPAPKLYRNQQNSAQLQLTFVISNSMGPWKKFESTVVRLKRSYEDTGSVVCLTTKGRQLDRNFEELKPASHVPIFGTILNIFDVFVAVVSLNPAYGEMYSIQHYVLKFMSDLMQVSGFLQVLQQ